MEDDIGKRLQETSDRCIKAYEGWAKGKKDAAAREELLEAVHDLRKVSSRVEIEVAVSERDEMAQRPLPIPPHRAQRAARTMEETPGFMATSEGDQDREPQQGGGGASRGRRPMRGPRPGGSQGADDNQGNS
jgi:hypothetical protein